MGRPVVGGGVVRRRVGHAGDLAGAGEPAGERGLVQVADAGVVDPAGVGVQQLHPGLGLDPHDAGKGGDSGQHGPVGGHLPHGAGRRAHLAGQSREGAQVGVRDGIGLAGQAVDLVRLRAGDVEQAGDAQHRGWHLPARLQQAGPPDRGAGGERQALRRRGPHQVGGVGQERHDGGTGRRGRGRGACVVAALHLDDPPDGLGRSEQRLVEPGDGVRDRQGGAERVEGAGEQADEVVARRCCAGEAPAGLRRRGGGSGRTRDGGEAGEQEDGGGDRERSTGGGAHVDLWWCGAAWRSTGR